MSLQVGPNADRLAQCTGYSREFVGALIEHMEEAGLWTNGPLDDREWWDSGGETGWGCRVRTCAGGIRTCSKRNDFKRRTLSGPNNGRTGLGVALHFRGQEKNEMDATISPPNSSR
jgi:hypothetical protein